MKPKSTTIKAIASLLASAAIGAALPAQASTFTVGGSGNNFTITRHGDTSAAETVHYRTVPLSAFPGQHYTEKGGTLVFAPGQTGTNITVSAASMSNDAYRFQTGSQRTYRFELTDDGGFLITNKVRNITTGTSVPSSGAFNVKDVTIQSAEYTADDRGYAENGYKSVASSNYFNNAASREYYSLIGAQLRMTLSMQAKENDDAYEYLQLLFDNTSSCDNRSGASNGDPGTPSLSSYMAGFEMDTGSKDDTYRTYTFPVTNVASSAGDTNPWGYGTKYPLKMQKFNTATGSRATDGRIVVPLNFSSIVLRLNASGSSGSDEWAAKNVKAHIQAVDFTQPTLYGGNVNAISVSPGPHCKGNEFYISIPFNEIVSSAGSKILRTTWGSMDYHSGNGSNVITFKGTVNAAANTTLAITNCPCTFKDLANNYFQGSLNKTFSGTTVSASYAYSISYDLGGGTLPSNAPMTYTYDASVPLLQPTRTGYTFDGWTGSNGSSLQKYVTISAGSHGPRAYTAHWSAIAYTNIYDLAGGALPEGLENPATYAVTNAAYALVNPVRTGYTFVGWTGTGLDEPTNEVTVAAGSIGDRSYVAIWTNNAYTVCFHANDGSGATHNQDFLYDEPQSLDLVSARTGYGFSGWTANADGTGDTYRDGQVVSNLTSEANVIVDLYARWYGNSYSIHFDKNADDASGHTDEMGMTYDVADNLNANDFKRVGYDFAGWSTSTNGAVVYADGQSVSNLTAEAGKTVTLYAQWTAHAYTVHFDANGGEGEMPDQTLTYDAPQALSSNAFTRAGFTFIGWSVGGEPFADGATVSNLASEQGAVVSLVAQWGVPYIDADGAEQLCANYTVITNSAGDVEYGGRAENWYFVCGDVTIDGNLCFLDTYAHLILADGVTLAVTNASGNAIKAYNLAIYCQENGTGSVTATSTDNDGYGACDGIYASGLNINGGNVTATGIRYGIYASSVTVNGGSVTANGSAYDGIHADGSVTIGGGNVIATGNDRGIYAYRNITLGWANPGDSITASSYSTYNGTVTVKAGQILTDGTAIYQRAVDPAVIAGKTLRPYFSPVPYVDANGDELECTNYIFVTSAVGDVSYGEDGATNWYVVTTNVTIGGNLCFADGSAHLILCDGATLAVTNTNGTAIGGPDVTIYGQADGTGVIAANGNCGINAGYVTINGVNITSTGGSISGIGASTVIINGGNVTVNSDKASGISCGYFTINGGNVTASGNDSAISAFSATINGGGVTATGGSGITGHDLIINDGIVTVTGSNDGIGVANVTISGGTVTATGINGHGIYGSTATISGGLVEVTATGSNGIQENTVTINGGTVSVTATGNGGYGISGGVITLGWTDAMDSITASSYDVPSIIVNDGQFLTDGTAVYSGTLNLSMDETLSAALAGKTFRPAVSYIDADGETQYCTNFTVVASAGSHAVYGEPDTTNWFVVVGNAAIDGTLYFIGDAHLILADGATLAVTNTSGTAINANCNLAIYGQAGGTGVVVANGIGYGIYANQSFAINGGTVNATATDGHGICSCGNIILGWTNLGDSIFASSYNGTVSVKDGQLFTDGTDFYQGEVDPDAIACAMLRPYISRWQRLQEQLDAGGTVILTNDVTAIAVDATLVVTNSVALDLNGHTIDAASLFGAIRVAAGGHLTLTNSLAAGAITDGNSDEFGGGVYVDEDGAFTMTGGAISGNTADDEGGGVYVADDGEFTMAGGAISGNDADDGGGVYVAEYGVFTMAGGAISGNDARDGGGVYVAEYGVFTMSGGEISGNSAAGDGGGVYMYYCNVSVLGSPVVFGNTNSVGAASNLYMDSWREIAVRGLSAGAYIGVTTKTAPTESSPVTFATGAAEGDETYFTSDNPGFAVYGEDGSLRLRLVVTYTVRFDANGGAGAMPDQTFIYDAQQALASNAFTRTGYTFAGWRGGDGSIYPDGATVSNLTVRHASLPADAWKLFDRMPYPGKSNDDYTPSFGDLQNKDGDNGLNLYTGFENVAWNPEDPDTVAILSANAFWFDEHDARNGVSMQLIEDFPNFYFPGFYIEQVDDAQGAAVTLTAIWQPHVPVPYIDADGNEQMCTIYNVLTNANGDVAYGELGAENWYVVTNDVTISGRLYFADYHAHLIVCDGATLNVTNENGNAIAAYGLAIHCQTNATGALVANGSDSGIDGDSVTINGGSVTATGGVNGICAYAVTINGGNVNATGGTYGIYPLYDLTINGGNVNATGGYGIWAKNITLGWTNPTDSIYASSYFGRVRVKSGKLLTDGYGGIYEGDIQDNDDIAGKTLWPGFKDPEGRIIVDFAVIDWLSENGFTQADIDALGHDAAATDRLYECWLLNLNFKVQDAGATLCFTDITVSNRVSMTVQLVRKAPLAGWINGTLLIYGANDLAAGFDRDPIPDESVEYFTGDPSFNLVTASNDTVTQTAVATLNSSVTAKFFKAEIGIFTPYEPEDPWEPEPEDPEPEEPEE